MTASDDLSKLSVRAKEAEDRVGAAREKEVGSRANLDFAPTEGRGASRGSARSRPRGAGARFRTAWKEMQITWNHATAALSAEEVENRKAEHDLHKAEGRADRAEEDARFAIDFAYSAIAEAEYAALDAALARMEANELSKQAGATA